MKFAFDREYSMAIKTDRINDITIYPPLSLFLLVFFLASCFSADAPLRIAIHPWVGYQSLTLAKQEEQLDTKLVQLQSSPSLSESSRMVAEGSVDGAALTLEEVLVLREQGVPLTVVLIFDVSAGADLVLSRTEIERLEELAGKRIGLEDSVLSKLILSEVLKRAGLEEEQVALHYGIVSEHARLWQENNLDALITYLPLPKEIITTSNRLFDSNDIPNTILDVLAIRSDRLESFRPALEHLLKKHFAMAEKMRANAPDTLHRLAPVLGMSVEETASVLRELILPGLEYNQRLLQESGQLATTTTKVGDIMLTAGLLASSPDLENLVNDSFLPFGKE